MAKEYIEIDNKKIELEIIYKSVKNINITIKPGPVIRISCNRSVSKQYIKDLLLMRKDWILNSLARLENITVKSEDVTYDNKDVVSLLGAKYTINLVKSNVEKIVIDNQTINIYAKDINDVERRKRIYELFVKRLCEKVFNDCIDKYIKYFDIKKPALTIRKMTSRWGSCMFTKSKITLNSELIKAPIECIEYVVVHELCHFIHPNHSKDFHKAVEQILPDYKKRKEILNKTTIREI